MELDGLASNANPLGDAAEEAVAFVVGHMRSHADSPKVQTSLWELYSCSPVGTSTLQYLLVACFSL